jgi:hypothetical protein
LDLDVFCDLVSLLVGCAAAGAALLAIQVFLAARGEIPPGDMSSEVLFCAVLMGAVFLDDYNQQKQRIN